MAVELKAASWALAWKEMDSRMGVEYMEGEPRKEEVRRVWVLDSGSRDVSIQVRQ